MRPEILKIGNRTILSQDRSKYRGPNAREYLYDLLKVMSAVEQYTGYKWKVTSFIRDSPNHKMACALDIAPDIASSSLADYAVTRRSDPVLYKRTPLIRALQKLCREVKLPGSDVGLFIEPDHIHVQLFEPESLVPEIYVFKWKIPKPVYGDTYDRMKLPMTCCGYH